MGELTQIFFMDFRSVCICVYVEFQEGEGIFEGSESLLLMGVLLDQYLAIEYIIIPLM